MFGQLDADGHPPITNEQIATFQTEIIDRLDASGHAMEADLGRKALAKRVEARRIMEQRESERADKSIKRSLRYFKKKGLLR